MRRRARERQDKREDRPILKRLRAILLRSIKGAARRKNGLCEGSARGNWDPREGQQPFRTNPNEVGDRTNTLRRLLIGVVQFCSLCMYGINYIYRLRQKFRTSLSKKIGVDTCFGDGQKVRNDD